MQNSQALPRLHAPPLGPVLGQQDGHRHQQEHIQGPDGNISEPSHASWTPDLSSPQTTLKSIPQPNIIVAREDGSLPAPLPLPSLPLSPSEHPQPDTQVQPLSSPAPIISVQQRQPLQQQQQQQQQQIAYADQRQLETGSMSVLPSSTTFQAAVASSTRPPISTVNTNGQDFTIKNAVAGGFMSSPARMSSATYVSNSLAPSSINSSTNADNKGSERRGRSNDVIRASGGRSDPGKKKGSVSALTNLLAATDPNSAQTINEKSSAGAVANAVHKAKIASLAPRPDVRPYYSSIGNMGAFLRSPRSMSYNGTATASNSGVSSPALSTASREGSLHNSGGAPDPYSLRRSRSAGKSGKKGVRTGLKKFRARRESRDSTSSSAGLTSGESDSEVVAPGKAVRSLSGGVRGLGHKMAVSLPSSAKSKALQMDPTLPPPPPIRTNSGQSRESFSSTMPTYALYTGFASLRAPPLSAMSKSFSNTGSTTPRTASGIPSTSDSGKESSATRFKEMLKRNVGLTAAASSLPSSTHHTHAITNPLASTAASGPAGNTKTSSQNWNAVGEPLSGDDQSGVFDISRFTGGTKKLTGRVLSEGKSAPSDDKDSVIHVRENPHGHHYRAFLPYLHRRHHRHHHRRRSTTATSAASAAHTSGDDIPGEKERRYRRRSLRRASTNLASRALMDARQCVTDPNILIAEVEPLPVNFASAFAVLVSKPTWTPTITPAPPPTPAPSFINKELTMTPATSTTATTPSSITATTTKKPSIGFQQLLPSATMISTTSSNSSNFNGSLIAFQTPLPHPSFHQLGSSPSPAPSFISPPQRVLCRTAKYVENVLSPRDFLFKSYLNSKFQGHYVFRVHGDQVEYAKLHVGLEQACSQYFREADVTYRAMESKAKVWREERKAAQAKREREFEEVRESVALQSAAGLAQHRGSISRSSRSSISSISGISISSQDSSISSQGSSSVSINTSKDIDGDTIDASSRSCAQSSAQDGNDGDQSSLKSSPGMILNHEHLQEPSDTLTSSPEPMNPVPLIVKPAVIPKVTFDTIADADEETTLQPSRNDATSIDSADRVDPNLGTASAMKSTGRRHPFTIQEQEGMEQQLWAIDNGYWNGIERDHNEETRQAVYGLEMYMMELVKTVEYERFDLICNIEILNESRDTTLFSIMNGDKTNLMFLESPSVKQKHEFLNWIAISLMDHGEPEEAAEDARMKSNRPSYIDSVVLGGGKGGHHQDLSGKDVDNLLDLANVRLSLLVTNMRDKHDETQITMKQIEYFLEKLDNLDENSKKLETEMVRVLDSHELRSSLQPSPTTGLTLTQTVEAKVKDVNERIVVCARIMTAARLNLNRLKYEIELEQRSMRLFRQYKIAIAIVSISILGLLWLLYHRHRTAASFPPESPLSAPWSQVQEQKVPPPPLEPSLFSINHARNPFEFFIQYRQHTSTSPAFPPPPFRPASPYQNSQYRSFAEAVV